MGKLSVITMLVVKKKELQEQVDNITKQLKVLIGEERKPHNKIGYKWSAYSRKKLSKAMKLVHKRKRATLRGIDFLRNLPEPK
jgi:hypothetical protein